MQNAEALRLRRKVQLIPDRRSKGYCRGVKPPVEIVLNDGTRLSKHIVAYAAVQTTL